MVGVPLQEEDSATSGSSDDGKAPLSLHDLGERPSIRGWPQRLLNSSSQSELGSDWHMLVDSTTGGVQPAFKMHIAELTSKGRFCLMHASLCRAEDGQVHSCGAMMSDFDGASVGRAGSRQAEISPSNSLLGTAEALTAGHANSIGSAVCAAVTEVLANACLGWECVLSVRMYHTASTMPSVVQAFSQAFCSKLDPAGNNPPPVQSVPVRHIVDSSNRVCSLLVEVTAYLL